MSDVQMGQFWAVGVGPGDPELLTVKAVNVLQQADVIYHAGPEENRGRAWNTVQQLCCPGQECRQLLSEPMSVVSASDGKMHYRPGVEQIAADCRRGLDVAFVTEGDPMLYSTACRVCQLLAELHPDIAIQIIPGVSSITAAAARVGWPLARKDDMLAIVPAGYHADQLRPILDRFPSACLLKVAKALPDIVSILDDSPDHEAVYLENLATPEEWITHRPAEALGRDNYFSLMLVRRGETDRRGDTETRRRNSTEPASRGALAPGGLSIVGLGPGDPNLMTARAIEVLQQADVIIGYDGYLKNLESVRLRAELRGSPIGAERDRAVQALELASAGRKVALVSSGDAGVYGMTSLLLESAENVADPKVEIVPGVTAAIAAAALLGAPLGHDFACVSLSDLFTPWETIERRLEAAAQGDFVLALYNPVSRQRTWQLPRARDILLRHRQPETVVGLVDKAYRPGTKVWTTTLADLTTEGVGMETTVIIGNNQTRLIHGSMVTPRLEKRVARGEGRGAREEGPGARTEELGASKDASALARGDSPLISRPSSPAAGRSIMEESFAIIERELGPHSFPPWAFAVVRRIIHASADFDFVHTIRFSPNFEEVIRHALQNHLPIITDTEMVLLGIRTALAHNPEVRLACHLNDPDVADVVEQTGCTRSAAGIRLAARRYPTPILAIGNAPTAVEETLRLILQEGWRPAAIIAMPVGFVGVEEAKRRLLEQTRVPYLTCVGRKGGSAVTAAAVNALVELFQG